MPAAVELLSRVGFPPTVTAAVGTCRRLSSSSPPRPHDPDDRVTLGRIGEWEVRRFEGDGAKSGYSAPRGFLHVQLWHPWRAVSLLTPSRLTAGRYEAFPSPDGSSP